METLPLDFGLDDNYYLEQYFAFLESRIHLTKDDIGNNHHIYPKSIFGDNNITIRLSYKDHFKAHWFLYKIYETAGPKYKRPFMQMGKALFMFVDAKQRKYELSSLNEDELEEISNIVEEAKIANRLTSMGELNPFYGKTHSPECLSKMNENRIKRGPLKWTETQRKNYYDYLNNRNHDDVVRHYYFDPITLENYRFSNNFIKSDQMPKNLIPGRYTSDKERLLRSLSVRQMQQYLQFDWYKYGEDNQCFGTKHAYNPETLERMRIKKDETLPDGFIYGYYMTPEHINNRNIAAFNRRGTPAPWVAEKINRNPEKIRKTAEKHRGMKRTEATCKNISDKRKEFFANGGIVPTKGKKKYLNLETNKIVFLNENEVIDETLYSNEHTIRITDGVNYKFVLSKNGIPEGWHYAKRKTKSK